MTRRYLNQIFNLSRLFGSFGYKDSTAIEDAIAYCFCMPHYDIIHFEMRKHKKKGEP